MILVTEAALRGFATDVLVRAGVPQTHAELVADALVRTNLRGIDSHGMQLLPHYLEQIEAGEVKPAAIGHVVSENAAAMVYECENALGQVTSPICCDHAIRLAQTYGLGMVTAREANHYGSAFLWTERMSRAGMIGISMCDASMQVPPWQGCEPRLGTNPLSVAVPDSKGEGWLLDMATTTVAYGKLEQAKLAGKTEIPYGWVMDREGVPTTDMGTALKGWLMPLGGYKGSGLAMMVEILCGVLAGGSTFATQVTGIRFRGRPVRTNQMFLAIDVRRFMPLDEFQARMDWYVSEIKSSKPARGYDEILIAGEPERRSAAQRKVDGIPIPEGVWETIVQAAARHGAPLPTVEIRNPA